MTYLLPAFPVMDAEQRHLQCQADIWQSGTPPMAFVVGQDNSGNTRPTLRCGALRAGPRPVPGRFQGCCHFSYNLSHTATGSAPSVCGSRCAPILVKPSAAQSAHHYVITVAASRKMLPSNILNAH